MFLISLPLKKINTYTTMMNRDKTAKKQCLTTCGLAGDSGRGSCDVGGAAGEVEGGGA